ncbi:hypothetical protein PQX77_001720 [Marasmius sp. AFHP31]|nr:hypothetical protein PQX77_001720 [Marasmius sp. AFHP31]
MLLDLPSPVLTVAPDVLRHLEGNTALTSLWYLFTKCKSSVEDGQRLENISWRLWYREMAAATHSYRPLTPCSPSSELTDAPFVLSSSQDLSSRQPIGKVIYETMLPGPAIKSIQLQIPPEKKQKQQQQARELTAASVTLLPTPDSELLSISIVPQDQSTNSSPYDSAHTSATSSTSNSASTSPPSDGGGGIRTTINFSPAPMSNMTLFPRVVVVNPTPNPTPHPTPPATPTPVAMSVQLPVNISVATADPRAAQAVSGKLSVQFLQPGQPRSSSSSSSTSTPNPNSSTLFLHPLSRSAEPRNPQSPSTSAQEASRRSSSTPVQTQSNQGTGTPTALSSSHAHAVVSPSSSEISPNPPTSTHLHKPIVVPESQLPPSPQPSSSSVSSLRTTARTDISVPGSSAAVTRSNVNGPVNGSSSSNIDHSNDQVTAPVDPTFAAPNNGTSTVLASSKSRPSSSIRASRGLGAVPESSDTAKAVTPKFYLSSTTTTPSPGSGTNGSGGHSQSSFNSYSEVGSFGRRSDVLSHMSVSPIIDEEDSDSKQQPEASSSSSLINQDKSHSHPAEPVPPKSSFLALGGPISSSPQPLTTQPSTSPSAHSRTKRTSHSVYPYHVTPQTSHSGSSQSSITRKSKPQHSRAGSESSRSRSRSRNRMMDGLAMTSTTNTTAGGATRAPSDVGGTKPRPRRKGSGEGGNGTGGPRAAGDRGRYTRSNGYAIYQPQTKTPINHQQNNQNQPSTKAGTTGQQGKKGMFSVGNEEDEDEWEDDEDDGSSSMSRSVSDSRSRSRSGCSVSPAAPPPPQTLTPNGDAHSEGSRPGRSSSSSTQPTVAPTSVAANGDALGSKSGRHPPSPQQQSQQPPKQPNTVLGRSGRKIVISTDDDDDFDDDDDDEDDWEEEESEEVEAGKGQDMSKGTKNAPPNAKIAVEEVDGTDVDWTSASEDEGSRNDGGEANATVTTNFTTRTGATDATRGTATTHATSVYTNGDTSRGKGKDYLEHTQRPAPPKKSSPPPPPKPQHYPNPPAPQILQRAHSSRFVGGTGGLTQLPQQPPHVKRQHSQQPQQQQHQGQAPRPNQQPQPNQRHHHHHPNPRQPRHSSVDISQAALEAQRQRNMSDKIFEKKPKGTYTGLSRTGSGLLSQLMNPDPEIFPAHHPYRSRYSSGDVAMPKGVARLGVAPLTPTTPAEDSKPLMDERERLIEQPLQKERERSIEQHLQKEVKQGGISAGAVVAPHAHVAPPSAQVAASPPAPRPAQPQRKSSANYGSIGRPAALGLKAGKSAAALPVADAVTAASVKDNGMVKPKKDGSNVKSPAGGGVYRPKAQPHDAELEDTDTEDSQANEAQSVVQRQLAIIAGKAFKQNQRKLSGAATRPDIPPRAVTDTTLPSANAHVNIQANNPAASQIQRTQSQHVPGATARTILPLGYPYNLPLTAEPSSPRTTRQRMLGKEMSESVRSNLLWTRHLNRTDTLGPRRQSMTNVAATTNVNGHAGQGEVSAAAPPAPSNVSAVPSLVRLSAKKKPGRGQFVDAAGIGEPSVHEAGWAGDRPPSNPRRRSSAAVTSIGQQDQDGDGIEVGGANVVTRTRSWAGLAGGAGGMTRIL